MSTDHPTGLDRLADLLVNKSDSEEIRAIRLYEFQIALFWPESLRPLLTHFDRNRRRTKMLRTASLYVGSKFIEEIQKKIAREHKSTKKSDKDLAKNQKCKEIYQRVIVPNGGWHGLRKSIAEISIDKSIKNYRQEADVAAKIIDFFYGFEQLPNRKNKRGGRIQRGDH